MVIDEKIFQHELHELYECFLFPFAFVETRCGASLQPDNDGLTTNYFSKNHLIQNIMCIFAAISKV